MRQGLTNNPLIWQGNVDYRKSALDYATHAKALLALHLLTAVQHQRFVPQPTGVVTAKSSSIPQQKVPSTVNASRKRTIVIDPLFRKFSESRIPIRNFSEFHEHGKTFCVESVLTLRIIQFKLLISKIRTCNFENLFQWKLCLIYMCHVRAHALPTQNSNYQLQRWIDQHPKHLKGLQR